MADVRVRSTVERAPALVVLMLSLYFAGVFGISAAKALLWLHLGVTDGVSVVIALALTNVIHVSDRLMTLVAAALGATKLAVAGFFVLAATERAATVFRGEVSGEHGALDLALLGGAALMLLTIAPNWAGGDLVALHAQFANLVLLTVAGCSAAYELRQGKRPLTRTDDMAPTPQPNA